MYDKTCRRCSIAFEAAAKTTLYCQICRNKVRLENREQTKMKQKVLAKFEPNKGIDPKWLSRGNVSLDANTDMISNGA